MPETRELTLQERGALICALAAERSNHFRRANELREASCKMEDDGKSGYLALDIESEQHEIFADVCDLLLEFAVEGRILIVDKEDVGEDG
ncbi:MAG: hypothetical protein E7649_06200 [Ruminococcaceae bacterium]|nr:hypothetical protein [Oscillospiraceae bacterium]